MVLFRADANSQIGMGHVMRCLSIADAFRETGQDAVFLLADNHAAGIVELRGYKAVVLNSSYREMEEELSLWPVFNPDIIIVDSYFVSNFYLEKLKEKAKLVYLDDMASFPYPVDILVNYNAYGIDIDYSKLYRQSISEPDYVLGISYAPLREMFAGLSKKIQNKRVSDILFSTGGSDDLHIALNLVKSKPENYHYHILIGAMNTDKAEIKKLAALQENIQIHEDVQDMKSLISGCDIAISAAGSTLYEICACGVPLITYIVADNQIPGAVAFEKLGLAENCGDMRGKEDVVSSLIRSVERLAKNYNRRVEVGKRMQYMVDGQGAARLTNQIMTIINDKKIQ